MCSVRCLSLSQVNVNEFVAIPTVLLPSITPCPAGTVRTRLPVAGVYTAAVGVNLGPDQAPTAIALVFSDPGTNICA